MQPATRNHPRPGGMGEIQAFSTHFTASEISVRDVLTDLRFWLTRAGQSADTCGTVELVLAEALNNIVEHAYSETGRGHVQMDIWLCRDHLSFALCDHGCPLPDLALPKGQRPTLDCAVADLPEGGFGWFLIHRLTQALNYSRKDGQNHLCFDIVINEE